MSILGDSFHNISGSTIVSRSFVEHSFNRIRDQYDQETAEALEKVAQEVNKSGNKEAGELFTAFSEELQKPEPRKSLLCNMWNGLKEALPTLAKLADVTEKITRLFV